MFGDKSKASSQTDWKMAQNKMSEMGMMSYKVQYDTHTHTHALHVRGGFHAVIICWRHLTPDLMYIDLLDCCQWGGSSVYYVWNLSLVSLSMVDSPDELLLDLSAHILFLALQMHVYEHENFQGRSIEITGECINVCDLGMDKVRSLRVDCGP